MSDLTLKAADDSGELGDIAARRGVESVRREGDADRVDRGVRTDGELSRSRTRGPSLVERATEPSLACPSCGAARHTPAAFRGRRSAGVSLEHAIELQPYHPLALVVLRNLAERDGDEELLALVMDRLREIDSAGID